jgi:hypothetical protein
MAKRYSGDLVVTILYHDDDTYKGSVKGPGGTYKFSQLRAPAIGHGSGVGYDSPKAYDKMAEAAIGFATYDMSDLGMWDEKNDRGDVKVSRRKPGSSRSYSKRTRHYRGR